MRFVAALACVCSCVSLAACEPTSSPLNRIPKPTAPTPPSTEPYQPPTIVVVPPFRRTIMGTVRQVSGGPIAGVDIDGPPTSEGVRPRAVTAEDGSFQIDQTLTESLWFEKQGYHPSYWYLPRNTYLQAVQTVAIRMQPHIFISPGAPFASVITPDDMTFEGGYPFGDEGYSYECSPCKLISLSQAEDGAVLRLSWSGPVPLALWAGNTHSWDAPYINAIGRSGESELVRATTSRIDAVLVGLERRTGLTLTEPVAFTLTVETF